MQPIGTAPPQVHGILSHTQDAEAPLTSIAVHAPPDTTVAAVVRRGPSDIQMQFQQDKIDGLNAKHHEIVMCTRHRPIDDAKLHELQEAKALLLTIPHAIRSKHAQQYINTIYEALGVEQKEAVQALIKEALTLQAASVTNNALGLGPTLVGSLVPGTAAAAGAFAWQAAAQVIQPFVGVMIYNAIYYSVDLTRAPGAPGRSGTLENAKTLQETSEKLADTNAKLEKAIAAVTAAKNGRPEVLAAAKNALAQARSASDVALEDRARREVFDDSFDGGRAGQSILSALKQLIFYTSQYVAFAENKNCKGGKDAFYLQMGAIAAIQLLQLVVAPADRKREGKLIMAANLAYGPVDSKDDVRSMYRSAYVQKQWVITDGIDKRSTAKLKELAKQFNVSEKTLRLFEERGGFNQVAFCTPEVVANRDAWNAFAARSEGPPLADCQGALQELGKLVVLEDVAKLEVLEDLAKLGALQAVRQAHASAPADSSEAASIAFLPSSEELQDTLGIAAAEAEAMLQDGLPAPMQREFDTLQARYGVAAAGTDGAATASRPDQVEHIRATLGLASEAAAVALLQPPAVNARGVLPAKLAEKLVELKSKYQQDAPFEQLRDALGLASLDEAKALRDGPLPDGLRAQLSALQGRYETREGLKNDEFIDPSRNNMLDWAELARAHGGVLTELELAVRTRLQAKANTSTLNIHAWKNPRASGHPEEDQARRDKSLTPFEHALLKTLQVRPKIVTLASGDAGPVTDHAKIAADMPHPPQSMRTVWRLLKELREHRLDASLVPWDFTQLGADAQRAVANVLQGKQNWLANTKDAMAIRWNMPGQIVPVIVVAAARATFMGVGGTGFFFLLQAGLGLARKANPQTFRCEPVKQHDHTNQAEGQSPLMEPNHASKILTYATMVASSIMIGFAVLGAWGGPQAVNSSRVRREYFFKKDGRPTFWEVMKANYLYSARRAVTDYAQERLWTGPTSKARAQRLLAQAKAELGELAAPAASVSEAAESGIEMAVLSTNEAAPLARPALDNFPHPNRIEDIA